MTSTLNQIATTLDKAAKTAQSTKQISLEQQLTLEEAYAIQAQSIRLRTQRGERLTGYKLGFTSKEKMEQMGVHEIIWGRLTDNMHIKNNGVLEMSRFIHPRVEPEIAFRLSKNIDKILSLEEVSDYIDGIAPALEIIDSRYENFKFSLEDVIADNCSSSGYVIGDWLSPKTSIQDVSISLNINQTESKTGNTSAILGNPLESLVEISKMASKYGVSIKAGHIILAGAATAAVYLNPNDQVEANFQDLGKVSFQVV